MIEIAEFLKIKIEDAQFNSCCPTCKKQFYWMQTYKPNGPWLYYVGACCGMKWELEFPCIGTIKKVNECKTEDPNEATPEELLERMK